MQKLTITKVFKSDKDKNGNLLKTKDGRAYQKLAIKTKEYGDRWISGFLSFWNQDWKEGMIVGASVEPNGDFLNLKKPDPVDELRQEFKARIEALEQVVFHQNESQAKGDYETHGHVEEKDIQYRKDLPF